MRVTFTYATWGVQRGGIWSAIGVLVSVCAVSAAHAQVTSFPSDAKELTESDLRVQVAGKTFAMMNQDGTATIRMSFKEDGYWFLNMTGFSTSGKWFARNSTLCTEARDVPASCNEIRRLDDKLFMKRDSGKVEQFKPV